MPRLICVKDAGAGVGKTFEQTAFAPIGADTDNKETPMSHVPHELAEDFPDQAERISQLRQEDAHFARLADAYHEVNKQVHRVETDIEPMDDLGQQALRKQRMQLKDEIAAILRGAS